MLFLLINQHGWTRYPPAITNNKKENFGINVCPTTSNTNKTGENLPSFAKKRTAQYYFADKILLRGYTAQKGNGDAAPLLISTINNNAVLSIYTMLSI